VENLKLQVRMNIKTKAVELRTSRSTTETGAIQKGEDFVRAYAMGFDVEDAVAILRLDGIYIQSFEIKDVKTLEGDHLARAVGRIVGKDGRTKYAIENTTKTRIVVAGGSKIHILGGFKEIGMARESVVSLMYVSPMSVSLTLLFLLVTNSTVSASHQARCTATCGRSVHVSRSGSREGRVCFCFC
jgi:RNA-binding protein PNO1